MRTKRGACLLAFCFAVFVGTAEAVTLIAPTNGISGDTFTIIDTPSRRLVDGSVAIFRMGHITFELVLNTQRPFVRAQGHVIQDMYGGEYSVSVRQPSGIELAVGVFTVVGPAPPPPPFLYVLIAPENSIGPQVIASGTIGSNGSVTFNAHTPTKGEARTLESDMGLAASPNGTVLFVGQNESDTLESFVVTDQGVLTQSDQVLVNMAADVEVHPTLPLIYVTDLVRESGETSQVKVVAYTPAGMMTVGQTITTAPGLRGMAITPDGQFLLTTHIGFGGPRSVDLYTIDPDGNLSVVPVDSKAPTGAGRLLDVVIDPGTLTAYVKDIDEGIYAYSLAGGSLTPLNGGAPYSPTVGALWTDVKIGNGVLFTSQRDFSLTSSNLDTYQIAPTGELTYVATRVVPDLVDRLAIDKIGNTLFGSGRFTKQVYSFKVGSTLTLTDNVGSPFAVVTAPENSLGNILVVQR